MKDNSIIYIADIDQDIDDIIAAEYLHIRNVLMGVVLDPLPKSVEGWSRVERLEKMGVKVFKEIPLCNAIFIGGAFTKVAEYLEVNNVHSIVANGGFVGSNIVKLSDQLDKFKGKKFVRTFNFNIDVESTVKVLNSLNVVSISLIGKNVCHSEKNTINGIWKNHEFLKKYHLKDIKRLHDLLMCREGINLIDGEPTLLDYRTVTPINEGLKGNMTKWGSQLWDSQNMGIGVKAAVGWK